MGQKMPKFDLTEIKAKLSAMRTENGRELTARELLYKYRVVILILVCLFVLAMIPVLGTPANQKKEPVAPAETTPVIQEDGRGVMVINYHKIENKHHSLSVELNDFEKHMAWLHEYGYHSITPEQLYAFVNEGAELPDNPVLITFDDGYVDNYTNAYPIMRKYGFVGTIFVVTTFLDKFPGYLKWSQARELTDAGWNIESHTATHISMTEASDEKIKTELEKARADIQEKLGKEADFVAYPTGTYNLHIAQMVKDAGYKAAFTIKYDNVSRNSNVYALERVPIFHTDTTNKDFLERIKYIPLMNKYGWSKK